MTTVYDVPPDKLIEKIVDKIRTDDTFQPPEWTPYVKTGTHKEKPPTQDDWWYIRTAAVLRKIYLYGPIGVVHLANEFGGAKDRGSKPYKHVKGSRSIIRGVVQQLEKGDYITAVRGNGRAMPPKGQSFLDNAAHEVLTEIIKENPELGKY